jgi:hypothetical protein
MRLTGAHKEAKQCLAQLRTTRPKEQNRPAQCSQLGVFLLLSRSRLAFSEEVQSARLIGRASAANRRNANR